MQRKHFRNEKEKNPERDMFKGHTQWNRLSNFSKKKGFDSSMKRFRLALFLDDAADAFTG
jgi:hypothetical protein